MRKTTQTVEIEVEGPNEDGKYRIDNDISFHPISMHTRPDQDAIQKHIDSAPKVKEIDGYLVGAGAFGKITAWVPDDPHAGDIGGIVAAGTKEEAWEGVGSYSYVEYRREYVRPMLAVIKYFEGEDTE